MEAYLSVYLYIICFACTSHTYQLYDIYNVPEVRDQFLNPRPFKNINDTGQN